MFLCAICGQRKAAECREQLAKNQQVTLTDTLPKSLSLSILSYINLGLRDLGLSYIIRLDCHWSKLLSDSSQAEGNQ